MTEEELIAKVEPEDAEAQWKLGDCYYNGKGVEQDYGKAAYWYEKSTKQLEKKAWDRRYGTSLMHRVNPLSSCYYYLGDCYCHDKGIEKDLGKAIYWWKKSFEQGTDKAKERKAQERLVNCYYDFKADKWYEIKVGKEA